MPWAAGPVTVASVIVPVMVPDVVAGQTGWLPPPHRNIMTPPATFVGAKCRWDTARGVDRSENVSEKVMLFPTSMRNAALPSVLIGGTSLSPRSVAEKTWVSAGTADAVMRPAASAAPIQMAVILIFIVCSCCRRNVSTSVALLHLPWFFFYQNCT